MVQTSHKTLAVMFTDIAGFTSAMEKDEEIGFNLLEKHREILTPLISSYNGILIKEMGDGTLSVFHKPCDSINCAKRFQEKMNRMTSFKVRIGIHFGNVFFLFNDVFGDAVNVASRLESIAAPGGISVSGEILKHLKGRKLKTLYLGLKKLKGLGRLIEVYALLGTKKKPLPVPDSYEDMPRFNNIYKVPSIAVMCLRNMGPEEDDYYAYGITSDLVTSLSRAGSIRVASMKNTYPFRSSDISHHAVASNLGVRFIVNGSLWKKDDTFHISLEIFDDNSRKIVWFDNWQDSWRELPAIKSKIADSILKILGRGELSEVEILDIEPPGKAEAYEFYLRARHIHCKRKTPQDISSAKGLLEKAIHLDPNLIEARNWLSWLLINTCEYNLALRVLDESFNVAEKTGNREGKVHALINKGIICQYKGEYSSALDIYRESLDLLRKLGDQTGEGKILNNMGVIYWSTGKYGNAIHYYEKSLAIKKMLGDISGESSILNNIGVIYFSCGCYKRGIELCRQALEGYRSTDDRNGEARTLNNIGLIFMLQDMHKSGLPFMEQALEKFRDINDREGEGRTLGNIAELHLETEKYKLSEEGFQKAFAVFNSIGAKTEGSWVRAGLLLSRIRGGVQVSVEDAVSEAEKVKKNLPVSGDDRINTLWILTQVYDELASDSNKEKERIKFKKQSFCMLSMARDNILQMAEKMGQKKLENGFLKEVRKNRRIIEMIGKKELG